MKLQPVLRGLSDTSPLLLKQVHAVWYNKSIVFTPSLGLRFCGILLCIIVMVIVIIIIIIIIIIMGVVIIITLPILFALKCRALYHYPSHQPRNASVKSHEIQQPPASMLSPFLFTFSLLDRLPFCWSRNPWRQLRDTSQKDICVGGSNSTQKQGVPITDPSTGRPSLTALNLTNMDVFFHLFNY